MKALLIVLVALFACLQARAQMIVINPPRGGGRALAKDQQVTVSITLSTPVAAASVANDWAAELNDANQSLYKVVGAECAVLNAVFKGQCKLVRIATTGNVLDRNNFGNPRTDGTRTVNASANATFEIEPSSTTPSR